MPPVHPTIPSFLTQTNPLSSFHDETSHPVQNRTENTIYFLKVIIIIIIIF